MLYLSLTGHDPIPEGWVNRRRIGPTNRACPCLTPAHREGADHAPQLGGAAGPSHFVVASRGVRLRLCAAPALSPAREADDHARSMVSVA